MSVVSSGNLKIKLIVQFITTIRALLRCILVNFFILEDVTILLFMSAFLILITVKVSTIAIKIE